MTALFDLKDHGVTVTEIHRNLPARCTGTLSATRRTLVSAENGALIYSGIKTGRSPKDKQVVKHPDSEADMSVPEISANVS
jgi:phosphoenolpyruvate carboxykinase (ATP)